MVFQLHTRSTFKYRKLSFSFEVLNQYSCSPSMKDWFWSLMRRIKFELIMQSVVLLRWSSRRDLPAAYSQVLPTDLLILTNISSTLNTLAGKLYCRTKQSVAPISRAQTRKNKWCHHWCWNWEEFLISQYWHLYWWKDKIWIRWIWSEALSSDCESQLTISYKSIGIVWAYNPTWQNLWTTLQIPSIQSYLTKSLDNLADSLVGRFHNFPKLFNWINSHQYQQSFV